MAAVAAVAAAPNGDGNNIEDKTTKMEEKIMKSHGKHKRNNQAAIYCILAFLIYLSQIEVARSQASSCIPKLSGVSCPSAYPNTRNKEIQVFYRSRSTTRMTITCGNLGHPFSNGGSDAGGIMIAGTLHRPDKDRPHMTYMRTTGGALMYDGGNNFVQTSNSFAVVTTEMITEACKVYCCNY
ncbi:MAG: hypothetical protein OXB84_08000 [Halobacteriovoraceae bacterium]|nr:hypothetical protein [Halobacteriovoraceae bacterium]